jgi:hypothetical protein
MSSQHKVDNKYDPPAGNRRLYHSRLTVQNSPGPITLRQSTEKYPYLPLVTDFDIDIF